MLTASCTTFWCTIVGGIIFTLVPKQHMIAISLTFDAWYKCVYNLHQKFKAVFWIVQQDIAILKPTY